MEITNKSYKFRKYLFKGKEDNGAGRNNIIEIDRINSFGTALGGMGFHRIFFGLEAHKAVQKGYLLTERSYFEASDSPPAIKNAKISKKILKEMGYSGELAALDPFMGTGQVAWAFGREGFKVEACERHKVTYECAQRNIKRALNGNGKNVRCLFGDGIAKMVKRLNENKQCSVIYLDPPWNGKYRYTFSEPFCPKYTDPPVEKLVSMASQISPIVIFKFPQNVDKEAIKQLGKRLNLGVVIIYYAIEGFKKELNEASVFFIRNGGFSYRTKRVRLSKNCLE